MIEGPDAPVAVTRERIAAAEAMLASGAMAPATVIDVVRLEE
ncbi:hypothetical protein [Sphingomonas sp. IW22]